MNIQFYSPIKYLVLLISLSSHCYGQLASKILGDSLKGTTDLILNAPTIDHHYNKFRIGDRNLRTPEILDRLSQVDSSDYKLYQKGRKDQKTGVAIALGGVGLLLIADIVALGSAVNDIGNYNVNKSSDDGTLIALFAMSGGLVIGGFVKTLLGKKVKNKAINDYNQHINQKKQTSGFYVNPGLTGISLGLRF